MRPAVGFGLLVLSWLAVAAPATNSRLDRVVFSGTDYVRLDQWASRNGFKNGAPTHSREVRFTNSGTTLVFEADSQKILINGITVYLSSPIGRVLVTTTSRAPLAASRSRAGSDSTPWVAAMMTSAAPTRRQGPRPPRREREGEKIHPAARARIRR